MEASRLLELKKMLEEMEKKIKIVESGLESSNIPRSAEDFPMLLAKYYKILREEMGRLEKEFKEDEQFLIEEIQDGARVPHPNGDARRWAWHHEYMEGRLRERNSGELPDLEMWMHDNYTFEDAMIAQANLVQDLFLRNIEKIKGVSTAAFVSGEWITFQSCCELFIRRPFGCNSQPAVILWNGFNEFRDDLQRIEPSRDDAAIATSLSIIMSNFVVHQSTRRRIIREILGRAFGSHEIVASGNESANDLKLQAEVKFVEDCSFNLLSTPFIIVVDNAEIDGYGGDPFLRGVAHYLRSIDIRAISSGCRLHCMLILIAGPHMAICAATIGYGIVVDFLSPFLPFLMDESTFSSIVKMIAAARRLSDKLKLYYQSNIFNSSMLSVIFPYKTSCRCYVGENTLMWTYLLTIGSKSRNMLYIGETNCNQLVIVKFATQYCPEAHALCATRGYAPQLLGYEDMGDFKVIVTEISFLNEDIPSNALSEEQKGDLRDAIQCLHAEGYIFGNLRRSNVFVDRDGRVKLYDFEFAGLAGYARYPFKIDRDSFEWPEDVVEGGKLQKEHDLWFNGRDFTDY